METKDLIHSYLLLALPNGNDFTFRPGFYAIAETRTVSNKYNQDSVIAKGFYSHSPTFQPFIDVEFKLNPLRNFASIGPKSLFFDNLIGTIIEIKEVSLSEYVNNGKPTNSYKIVWDFIGEIEEVTKHFRLKGQQDELINTLIMSDEEQYNLYLQEELEVICLEQEYYKQSIENEWDKYFDDELEVICLENESYDSLNEDLIYDDFIANNPEEELNSISNDPTEDDFNEEPLEDDIND